MATGEGDKANDLFTALAHPLRRRILRRMIGSGEISPRDLATEFDEQLSSLSYHVRVLAECGAVKLVRTKQIRGSTQHFYRAAVRTQWARKALGTAEGRPKKSGRRGEEKG